MESIAHAETVLLIASLSLLIVQLLYHWGLYDNLYRRNRRVAQRKTDINDDETPPLSVILCVHNEAERLRRLIPLLMEQDYPCFEVVVVNNASVDNTDDVLTELEKRYANLRRSFTPQNSRYISRRKLALTIGIKGASHDWVLFTEADCTPASNQWLRLMARNFTPTTQIVVGFSGHARATGWWRRKAALTSLIASLRFLSAAQARFPYMATGRNMAYRRELFFRQKGFSAYLNLRRGEDDLFINGVMTRQNTRVETDEKAAMLIDPPADRYSWLEERIARISTARRLRGSHRYVWGFETATRYLFYLLCTALFALALMHDDWWTAEHAALIWLLHTASLLIVTNRAARTVGSPWRFRFSLIPLLLTIPVQSLRLKIKQIFEDKGEYMSR